MTARTMSHPATDIEMEAFGGKGEKFSKFESKLYLKLRHA
jgi:hypothetical protein